MQASLICSIPDSWRKYIIPKCNSEIIKIFGIDGPPNLGRSILSFAKCYSERDISSFLSKFSLKCLKLKSTNILIWKITNVWKEFLVFSMSSFISAECLFMLISAYYKYLPVLWWEARQSIQSATFFSKLHNSYSC